ncbi:MAG: hypothetical protein F6K19_24825 [Cyanothece sp. SIO1E1]|nr:hypothetical protein [Cyanothece sp. SIO1E1]
MTIGLALNDMSLTTHKALTQTSTDIVPMDRADRLGIPAPFPDGIYLYGESAMAEQVGQTYVVFQVIQTQVRGALYLPQSEFSCFTGTVDAEVMHLTLSDPYEQTTYTYSLALQQTTAVATTESHMRLDPGVNIEGFHPIEPVGDNDRRILAACQATAPKTI